MNRHLFTTAFALGLLALLWVGAGFVGTSPMALLMTAVMAGVYGLGAWELTRFRATTAALARCLARAQAPADADGLTAWLATVPPPLQHPVRLRIEGERTGLPGPALTPYLVGLLVMLGMLGTFLGMVATFKGAVFALEGSTDLQAMRSALAAPIKGLGLAFGTSVAGVAASAMLGLMSALARRERAEAGRALDAGVATVFRPFSLVHQRQETFKALQAQAEAMPRVVGSLQAMLDGLERRSQQLNAQLLDQQARFHSDAAQAYTGLAASVGQSLHTSLAASAQSAGDALQRTMQAAMADFAQASAQTHQRQMDATHTQVAAATQTLEQRSTALLAGVQDTLARHEHHHTERLAQLTTLWRTELAALGAALEAPMARMVATVSEVPQAAAGVIAQLRQEMTGLTERDNLALAERTELVDRLHALLQGMEQAATHTCASAVELASLGDAFGHGMGLFNATHDKLTEGLARLETTLQQSMARSDEQLAYCVAQAREVIDLSIALQHGIVEDLRRLKAEARASARAPEGSAA